VPGASQILHFFILPVLSVATAAQHPWSLGILVLILGAPRRAALLRPGRRSNKHKRVDETIGPGQPLRRAQGQR
jgi:hypothetical protein